MAAETQKLLLLKLALLIEVEVVAEAEEVSTPEKVGLLAVQE